jgi:HEAT repeat protein
VKEKEKPARQHGAFAGRVLMLASLIVASMSVDVFAKDKRDGAEKYLSRFAAGDPGWKVRMEGLVTMVRGGPAAVPALVDALKNRSPRVREFAAQALSVIADPLTRPVLITALNDPDLGVRMYALRALTTLGPVELPDAARTFPSEGISPWMPSYVESALARENPPSPQAKRLAIMGYERASIDSARLRGMAPDFSLTDTSGRTYRLSQFQGNKIVILEFRDGSG